MATSGPGATNLVTGIATAYMDSVPIVAFTCNVGTSFLGKDSFQEVDIAGITLPIIKYSVIIKDIQKLAPMIRRAFKIAKSGRPGPVLVDITRDVTETMTEFSPRRPEMIGPRTSTIRDEAVGKAAEMINESERPVLFVGGGAVASNAAAELLELAHKADIPVCDSLMGKGAFPGTDPLYMGMVGMHGTKTANRATHMCDLIIAAGVRFSDRDTGEMDSFAKQAKIVQFDVDAAEINKNILVDMSVIGDLRSILLRLNPLIRRRKHADWITKIDRMKEKFPLKYDKTRLTGPAVIEELHRQTEGNAIIVTDVGQHQMWTAQYYKFEKPRTLLTSGGLGTMGYGLGAAIGAKTAFPDRTVVNIAGDGCFRMNMQELMTAVRYNIPVVEIVLNNHVLGMVRQLQHLFYGGRYSNTVLRDAADFVKIAEGMGALAMRVSRPEELPEAIGTALSAGRPVLIDCIIGEDDMVFPMAPSGEPIENAFDRDDMIERSLL